MLILLATEPFFKGSSLEQDPMNIQYQLNMNNKRDKKSMQPGKLQGGGVTQNLPSGTTANATEGPRDSYKKKNKRKKKGRHKSDTDVSSASTVCGRSGADARVELKDSKKKKNPPANVKNCAKKLRKQSAKLKPSQKKKRKDSTKMKDQSNGGAKANPTRKARGKSKDVGDLMTRVQEGTAVYLPSISIVLLFNTSGPGRGITPQSTSPAWRRTRCRAGLYWKDEMIGYAFARKNAGAKRGGRKALRQDHTYRENGMQAPLILTQHARQRSKERGVHTVPRYAPGTEKRVVATFVPYPSWKRSKECKRLEMKKKEAARRDELQSKMKIAKMVQRRIEKRKSKRAASLRNRQRKSWKYSGGFQNLCFVAPKIERDRNRRPKLMSRVKKYCVTFTSRQFDGPTKSQQSFSTLTPSFPFQLPNTRTKVKKKLSSSIAQAISQYTARQQASDGREQQTEMKLELLSLRANKTNT